jgi:hypothetical protein
MRRVAGRSLRRALCGSALGLVALCPPAFADPPYAPLDQPGPPLKVPADQLRAALQCQPSVAGATREPVLLSPGTGATADQNFSWNYEPQLSKLGIPWCAYHAPQYTLDDIQTSGEYLVYAIRTMYAMAGRRIAIVGHSQGGMSMRWALRFWPDTRQMVEDVIGFSPSNHGTNQQPLCLNGCPPADWQQASKSRFIAALNSYAETFAGISYTNVYTHSDEVVTPADNNNDASAALHTGGGAITNVATQDICPNDHYEHLGIGTVDPVAYALAIDALTHPGPADPARIDMAICSQLFMPGVDPLNANTELQIAGAVPSQLAVLIGGFNLVGVPETTSEPPVDCYVYAACPGEGSTSASPNPSRARPSSPSRARCAAAGRITIALPRDVRRARVTADGRRVHLRRVGGRLRATIHLARGHNAVAVRIVELKPGHRRLAITRTYRRC